MYRRSLFGSMLMALAAAALATPAQAQTCTGTVVYPAADHTTGPGEIMGGTYVNAQSSNNVREAFNERIHTNGYSRLYHAWRFDNVPPGDVSIMREGYRLASADSDNFKFGAYWDDGGGPFFIFGSFCTISSETESSQKCSLNYEATDYHTWFVSLADTVQSSGTALSAVSIDYVALCVEEPFCEPPPGGFCE